MNPQHFTNGANGTGGARSARVPVDDLSGGVPTKRAHSDGVEVDDLGHLGDQAHGECRYGREGRTGGYRVTGLGLPSDDSARGRVIRMHELLHAADTPRRRNSKAWPFEVANTAEDCIIHGFNMPKRRLSHLQRDCLAVALMDARHAARAARTLDPSDGETFAVYNRAVAILVRSLSLAYGATFYNAGNSRERAACSRVYGIVADALGEIGYLHARRAVDAASSDRYQQTCTEIATLMLDPAKDVCVREGYEGEDANGDDAVDAGDLGEDGHDNGGEKGEGDRAYDPTRRPMAVVRLNMTRPADPRERTKQASRSGSRMRAGAMARCVAGRTTSGLFTRNRPQHGGALLIDASGSMDIDDATLSAVCECSPAASIAYYNSGGKWCPATANGVLFLYADNGKRADLPESSTGGGNAVDLPALRWLLRQSGPRVLVTDRGFCGGNDGESDKAHMLLAMAERSGAVTVLPDQQAALAFFQGKAGGSKASA